MGLFHHEKKEITKIEIDTKENTLYAITNGRTMPIEEVSDELFSQKIMGDGIAFNSADGMIYAPCDGVVTTIAKTGHAFVISTSEGADILVHIGFDTVKEKGEGFTTYVATGDMVKAGDRMVQVDIKKLKKKGYDMTIPMIISNEDEFPVLKVICGKTVEAGTEILEYSVNK